jgi:tRNA(Ile2) C34 agmatinyltransferase TiaS
MWKLSGENVCIRCGGRIVHVGFKIYRCQQCGHEEKPEDL